MQRFCRSHFLNKWYMAKRNILWGDLILIIICNIQSTLKAPYFRPPSNHINVLSVDIKNWDKHQICIKSKFKNIHCVNLAFYK
jgi:hypothetical protein